MSFLFQEFCVGGWAADFVCEILSQVYMRLIYALIHRQFNWIVSKKHCSPPGFDLFAKVFISTECVIRRKS